MISYNLLSFEDESKLKIPSEIKPLLKKMAKCYPWNALIWPKNVMALKIATMDQMRKIVK